MKIEELEKRYEELFFEYSKQKYGGEEEPLSYIFLPRVPAGLPPFKNMAEEEEAYMLCIRERKPWQEIPELKDRIFAWHKKYLESIGAID